MYICDTNTTSSQVAAAVLPMASYIIMHRSANGGKNLKQLPPGCSTTQVPPSAVTSIARKVVLTHAGTRQERQWATRLICLQMSYITQLYTFETKNPTPHTVGISHRFVLFVADTCTSTASTCATVNHRPARAFKSKCSKKRTNAAFEDGRHA